MIDLIKRFFRWATEPTLHTLGILIFLAAFPLVIAYAIQYAFQQPPCPLCIYQRIPYFVIIGSCLLYSLRYFRYQRWHVVWISLALMSLDTGIAAKHVLVEQGFFEKSTCGGVFDFLSKKEPLEQFQLDSPTPSCKEKGFRIFGITLATLNLIYCILSTSLIMLLLYFGWWRSYKLEGILERQKMRNPG